MVDDQGLPATDSGTQRMMSSEQKYHASIGAVVSLMARSPRYCGFPVASITEWIRPAVLLDQILFFRNPSGPIVGYMTWAFLAEDTEHRLIHDPSVLLHLSEWNEGQRLWIMDMVVINGEGRRFAAQALRGLFPEHREARSLRRDQEGLVRKIVTWRRRA